MVLECDDGGMPPATGGLLAELRRLCLALPEVTEGLTHGGLTRFARHSPRSSPMPIARLPQVPHRPGEQLRDPPLGRCRARDRRLRAVGTSQDGDSHSPVTVLCRGATVESIRYDRLCVFAWSSHLLRRGGCRARTPGSCW